jgi:hypothetical protein
MRRKTTLSTLLAGAVLLAGCHDDPSPAEPETKSSAQRAAAGSQSFSHRPRTLNDEFANFARELPGFGGLFIEPTGENTGIVTVYLTDPTQAAAARAPIAAFLARIGKRYWSEQARSQVRVLRGQYDFAQLEGWYAQIISNVPLPGLTLSDVDERRNRIVIRVRDLAVRERVLAAIVAVGIPSGAVVVEQGSPTVAYMPVDEVPWEPTPELTLVSRVRPVIGGIQIQSASYCTLGFNVQRYNPDGSRDNRRFFMTNSHCTGDDFFRFGVVTDVQAGQPSLYDPIGIEVLDPPLFTIDENSACPLDTETRGKRYCRYSDAALFELYSSVGWAHAEIADVGTGTSGYAPILNTHVMNGETYALVGETVRKVGRTTGFSQGKVTESCVNLPQFRKEGIREIDTSRTMLCQKRALYLSDQGDSGSPVYLHHANGYRDAVGINWGFEKNLNGTIISAFSSLGFAFWEFDTNGGFGSGSRYLASLTNLNHR